MDISEQLEILLEMQKIDIEIAQVNARKGECPQMIASFKNELEQARLALKEREDNFKKMQVEHKNKELDLQSHEATIKKQQLQLYQVKTNREYSALQLEIEKNKADNSLLEEDIITLLEKIDAAKKETDAEARTLKTTEETIKQKTAAIESEMALLDTKIKELQDKREQIGRGVEKTVLAKYERIVHNKADAVGIVEVKDNMCGGCFMVTPPQVVNELKMDTKLIVCENCARILYLKKNELEEAGN